MTTPPVFLHDRELAALRLWTPENNRIQTMHLTADEHVALNEAIAKHGWIYSYEGKPFEAPKYYGRPSWLPNYIYRAKPAPAPTLSITVNGVTNVVAAPMTEKLVDGTRYWVADPSHQDWVADLTNAAQAARQAYAADLIDADTTGERPDLDDYDILVRVLSVEAIRDMLTTLAAENATLRASEAAAMERVKVLELALRYCGVSDETPGGIIRCAVKAALTPTADKEPKT